MASPAAEEQSPGRQQPPSTALFPLAPLLPGAGSEWRVRVCDVGALSLGEGGDVYSPLQRQGLCDVIGFEPVQVGDILALSLGSEQGLPAGWLRRASARS